MQRLAASPSSRTTSPPHTGQCLGIRNGRRPAPCFTTRTTFGITSPERSISTSSPISTPSRAISSSLCSVARVTVTPPTVTGAKCATGVNVPVRPTCTSMFSMVVERCCAGNLNAMAQRGALAVQPSACCWRTESTFTTTPSISYGNDSRFDCHSSQNFSSSSKPAHFLRRGFTLNPILANASSDSQWLS